VLSRVYSLTLLYNVLSRVRADTIGSASKTTQIGTFRRFQHDEDAIDLSRIQVTIATDAAGEKAEEASAAGRNGGTWT
jgi:hypothetical protein